MIYGAYIFALLLIRYVYAQPPFAPSLRGATTKLELVNHVVAAAHGKRNDKTLGAR